MDPDYKFSLDWLRVEPDMAALHQMLCEMFRIANSDCGAAIRVGEVRDFNYAHVYSFSLPGSRKVITCLITPVKPLFKTEGEVAAMDFVCNE